MLSHTPRNKWDNGSIERNTDSFGRWTREAAEQAGAYFIDLNRITGDKLEAIGLDEGLRKVNAYFNRDHTHTSKEGARLNAAGIAEGLHGSGLSAQELFIEPPLTAPAENASHFP